MATKTVKASTSQFFAGGSKYAVTEATLDAVPIVIGAEIQNVIGTILKQTDPNDNASSSTTSSTGTETGIAPAVTTEETGSLVNPAKSTVRSWKIKDQAAVDHDLVITFETNEDAELFETIIESFRLTGTSITFGFQEV